MYAHGEIQEVMASEISRGKGWLDLSGFQVRPVRIDRRREKNRRAIECLAEGRSVNETAALTHLHRTTVLRIRKDNQKLFDGVLCGCGRPARHSGWCRARISKSEAIQRFYATGTWKEAQFKARP